MIRKVLKFKGGARALTLTDFIPSDWEYVNVERMNSPKARGIVVLSIVPIRLEVIRRENPREISQESE